MFPKSRQQAWISGPPGKVTEGGIPLEVLPVFMPKPDTHSLSVTIYGSSELVSALQSLAIQRTKLPTFSLVVRTDPVKETDNQYLMTDAVIDSVLPNKNLPETHDVNIIFNSISAKMGIQLNPGPPINCPPVQPTGVNTGWIFGLPHEDIRSGKPVEIVDFTPPHYNRRLTVTLGKPSSELQALVQKSIPSQELILVLPDHGTQRYVEFKLWDAKATILADEKQVAFESNMIECLTGEEA
jgi:hypothetical protein